MSHERLKSQGVGKGSKLMGYSNRDNSTRRPIAVAAAKLAQRRGTHLEQPRLPAALAVVVGLLAEAPVVAGTLSSKYLACCPESSTVALN